jgi:hypothetical protein
MNKAVEGGEPPWRFARRSAGMNVQAAGPRYAMRDPTVLELRGFEPLTSAVRLQCDCSALPTASHSSVLPIWRFVRMPARPARLVQGDVTLTCVRSAGIDPPLGLPKGRPDQANGGARQCTDDPGRDRGAEECHESARSAMRLSRPKIYPARACHSPLALNPRQP